MGKTQAIFQINGNIHTEGICESEITYVKLRLQDLPAAGSIYSLWRWSSAGRPSLFANTFVP